jgi:hypothetical protein
VSKSIGIGLIPIDFGMMKAGNGVGQQRTEADELPFSMFEFAMKNNRPLA